MQVYILCVYLHSTRHMRSTRPFFGITSVTEGSAFRISLFLSGYFLKFVIETARYVYFDTACCLCLLA